MLYSCLKTSLKDDGRRFPTFPNVQTWQNANQPIREELAVIEVRRIIGTARIDVNHFKTVHPGVLAVLAVGMYWHHWNWYQLSPKLIVGRYPLWNILELQKLISIVLERR